MIRYYFIHNPIAGGHNAKKLANRLQNILNKANLQYVYRFWQFPEQLPSLIEEASSLKSNVVVGVGGDGTVHQIGKHLVDSPMVLGIIPIGSGNGFANHFHISRSPQKALQQMLFKSTLKEIDVGFINNSIPFFGFCGFGFDAEIAHLFAKSEKRGFLTYLYLILNHFRKAQCIRLSCSGFHKDFLEGYVITVCNISQYGNGAIIAPFAIDDDGMLDLCIVKRFSIPDLANLAIHLFTGTLYRHPAYYTFRCKEIHIKDHPNGKIQIDGEPYFLSPPYHIHIKPKALKILVPKRF